MEDTDVEGHCQQLMTAASERTGLSDFGGDDFKEPLSAWCKDLGGAHLSDRGRAFFSNLAVTDLARRLEVIACLKENPGIAEVPIPPILYITGLERSGTTLLHNLLALHAGARFLPRWQLMMPAPPPHAETLASDPRIAKVQRPIDALRGSDLEAMHWVDAVDPEECVWGYINCSGLLGHAPGAIMPRWMEWQLHGDMTATYEGYRKIIQLLTYTNRVPENGFLVLKAPQISRHIQKVSEVFPEAHFVLTHRDPYRAITSTCALVEIVNTSFLEDPDFLRKNLGFADSFFENGAARLNELARFSEAEPGRTTSVRYSDLLKDPVGETNAIYQSARLGSDPDLGTKVIAFLEKQRQGHRATPKKDIFTFGYVPEDIYGDERFKTYMETFQVSRETERQTGAG